MGLHPSGVSGESFLECLQSRKAAELGEALQHLLVDWQALRLLVRHHLEAMLDRAQEPVRVGQLVSRRLGDPILLVESDQHGESALAPKRRTPPAEHELLRLHEELDLADAAASELDVVPSDCDLVMSPHGMNLPLHGVHIRNGGEIEILAPDEGSQILEEVRAEG